MTDAPKTKDELLERIHSEYAALEQTIGRLSDEQMVMPIDGSWSAKDLLAHITAWEQIMLHFHIGGRPFNEIAQVDTVTYANTPIDKINEAFYQRDKDRPLPEALDRFRRSHQQLLATLATMGEADLYRSYTPQGRGPNSAGQLIDWIAGDSYEHYQEHRATMHRLIDEQLAR
jgi:hypothetical protein